MDPLHKATQHRKSRLTPMHLTEIRTQNPSARGKQGHESMSLCDHNVQPIRTLLYVICNDAHIVTILHTELLQFTVLKTEYEMHQCVNSNGIRTL